MFLTLLVCQLFKSKLIRLVSFSNMCIIVVAALVSNKFALVMLVNFGKLANKKLRLAPAVTAPSNTIVVMVLAYVDQGWVFTPLVAAEVNVVPAEKCNSVPVVSTYQGSVVAARNKLARAKRGVKTGVAVGVAVTVVAAIVGAMVVAVASKSWPPWQLAWYHSKWRFR